MERRAEWKIYYGDGTTFSSLDGPPGDAPRNDVQLVVQVDEQTGRYNQAGTDYYVWLGRWVGVDQFGLYDYLLTRRGATVVLFGRVLTNAEFKLVHDRAEADTAFPPRSAFRRNEPRPSR